MDRFSPIPLYYQIAEAIRYRIATGEIKPGAVLPPLREAAAQWGANLHTVRRAYEELARDRIVITRVPHGTMVLPLEGRSAGVGKDRSTLELFLERVVSEARRKHGLGGEELLRLLSRRAIASSAGPEPRVFVAECSDTQSADLAAQLMARWRVSVVPWCLDRPEPPGGSPVVATYFHYREVSSRWPRRLPDVHFVAIVPDPGIAARLRRLEKPGGKVLRLVLCEREESMLANMVADLSRLLPPRRFRIDPRMVAKPAPWLARRRARSPVLVSPRVWGELTPQARCDPRTLEVRYILEPRDLESLGAQLGWKSR